MIIFVSIAICLFLICCFAKKGHYFFCALFFIIGAYEFVGILYIAYFDLQNISPGLYKSTVRYINTVNIEHYTIFVDILLFTMSFFYWMLNWSPKGYMNFNPVQKTENKFWFLLFFLLILGVISIYTKSGLARVADYGFVNGINARQSPAIFYGRALLVVGAGLLLFALKEKKWKYAIIVLCCITPISYELFISGRRQSFAPSFMMIVMFIAYRKSMKYRKTILIILSLIFVVFSSFQFFKRGSHGLYDFSIIFMSFGELIAISLTGYKAFCVFKASSISYGEHFLVNFLNCVPFFRLGDFLLNSFGIRKWTYDGLLISPAGGLSMLADSFLAFHVFGSCILAFFLSVIAHWFHNYFKQYFQNGFYLSIKSLLLISLGSTFLMQYRNGINDVMKALISLAILYLFAVYIPKIFKQKSF